MASNDSDLVIVGGGAGGMVLALVLARKGYRVTIVDRQNPPMPAPRGEILQPNGLMVLDKLHILPELLSANIYQCDFVRFYQESGAPLCTINYKRLQPPYNYALILLPEVLQNLLMQKMRSEPYIQTRWGVSFKDVIWKGEQVIGISGDHCGKPISFHAPIVVGSDGVKSRVRDAFQIKHRLHPYRDGYVTMVVERPPGFQDDVHYYLGRAMIFGAFPVSDNQIYLFYLVPTDQIQNTRAKGIAHFKQEILSLNTEIHELFSKPLSPISSWTQCSYMPCFRVTNNHWVINGGALLGDAAHAMNPHVAQGRNSAMDDALALADTIEGCFNQGVFSRKSLSKYETARRSNIDSLQQIGHEMAWLWNSGIPPLVWVRDRIFRSFRGQKKLHDKMLRTISGLEISPLNFVDRYRALFR